MSLAPSVPHHTPTHGTVRSLAHLVNPIIRRVAGTRLVPLYGLLVHRGRRSGAVHETPIVVHATADGFLVPMPWGERTDWYRNVRAAGGCSLRWRGRTYQLVQPEVLSGAAARAPFGGFERAFMARLGIERCLRLRLDRE